jgi:hypothetical protein
MRQIIGAMRTEQLKIIHSVPSGGNAIMSTQDPLGVTIIGARRGTEILETREASTTESLKEDLGGTGGSETIIKQ